MRVQHRSVAGVRVAALAGSAQECLHWLHSKKSARYRLEQAKRLLLQTDLPVLQIARETGFRQAACFTSCFRDREGLTPRAYRNVFHVRALIRTIRHNCPDYSLATENRRTVFSFSGAVLRGSDR